VLIVYDIETKDIAINGNLILRTFSRLLLPKEKWDDDNGRMARFFLIVMFNNITLEVFQQSFITRTEPLPNDNQDWQNL
jgi:hypothetical protein